MKPNRHINFVVFLLWFSTFYSQSNEFLKVYESTPGYTAMQMSYSGIDTLSGNSFVMAGSNSAWTNGGNSVLYDSYIQKTEISGLTKWFRMYQLNGFTLTFKDIKVLPNKELLCAGNTNNIIASQEDPHHGILMKTDSNGIVQWCRLYPHQVIHCLLKRSDGNIGVLASDSGVYKKHLKLVLLNSSGELMWCKRLVSSDNFLYGANMIEGKNRSFLINANYSLLILIDSAGSHLNDLAYTPSSQPYNQGNFYRAMNNYNQGFYITGNYLTSSSYLLSSITKTDALLNVVWHKTYQSLSGHSEFHNILPLSANNLLVFCEPENYSVIQDPQRSGFSFFDSNGVYKKSYLFTSDSLPILPGNFMKLKNDKILFSGFNNQSQFFGIVDTTAGNFCKNTQITWNNVSNTPPINLNKFTVVNSNFNYSLVPVTFYKPFDLAINYVCSNGPSGPLDDNYSDIEEKEIEHNVKVYPSPSADFLYVKLNKETKRALTINYKVYNTVGQQVMDGQFNLDSNNFILDIRTLTDGLYYLVLNFDSVNSMTKKIIISK